MKNKGNVHCKGFLLRFFSIVIILLGIWLSADNIYKFTKGYFAYKTTYASSLTKEDAKEVNENNSSKDLTESKDVAKSITDLKNMTHSDNKEPDKVLYPIRPKIGDKIGELYIPKLNATIPIFHGTNEDELEKGVGHYAESVLPGENDNSVLSGHRDTVFRNLGDVGNGDLLIVRTAAGEFNYKVKKVRIVDKNDRTVIVPKPSATLTVSTCYPFNYIGSAPKRYILVAYLSSKTLN